MKIIITVFSIFFIFTAFAYGQFGREIDHKILGLGSLWTIAPSPDYSKLASAGGSGNIYIWDLETYEILDTINSNLDIIYDISWSPDGSKIACADGNEYITIWDVQTGEKINTFSKPNSAFGIVEWNPGKDLIAAASIYNSQYHKILIWDLKTGREIEVIEYDQNIQPHNFPDQIFSMKWNHEGTVLAIGGSSLENETFLDIWNASAFELDRSIHEGFGTIVSISWRPGFEELTYGRNDLRIFHRDLIQEKNLFEFRDYDIYPNSLSWNPDGSLLAIGSGYFDRFKHSIFIFDIAQQNVVESFIGHNYEVDDVFWSSDGDRIISGSPDNTIRIWDANTNIQLQQFHKNTHDIFKEVNAVDWSPDGNSIAAGIRNSTIEIWDAASGSNLLKLAGHTQKIPCVAWSPANDKLASASHDSTIKIWHPDTGVEIKTLIGHKNIINSLSWSPDGKKIVTGSKDSTVKIWDIESGTAIFTDDYQNDEIFSVAWNPQGKQIAFATGEGIVKVLDIEEKKKIFNGDFHAGFVGSVSWSPDGKKLATGSGFLGKTYILDPFKDDNNIILNLTEHNVRKPKWSPDGKYLAGIDERNIKILDANSGEQIRIRKGHEGGIESLEWSPDGKKIVSGSRDGTIRTWDAFAPDAEIAVISEHSYGINSISWRKDDLTIVSAHREETIKIWNTITSTELKDIDYSDIPVIEYSPVVTNILAFYKYNQIFIWDEKADSLIARIYAPYEHIINDLSWSQDGKYLASGGADKKIGIWDVEKKELVTFIEGHLLEVYSLAWSPNSKKLASGSKDRTIKIWNIEDGRLMTSFNDDWEVSSLCWSPDGTKVASGNQGFQLQIWNVTNESNELKKRVHQGFINSVKWHPNGLILASGSGDNSIKIWDVKNGDILKTLLCNDDVHSVAWSHDGKKLAAAGAGGTIRIWNYDDIVSAPEEIANENDVEVYPNPFSERCIIRYDLQQAGNVQLKIFNSVGELVEARDFAYQAEGMHSYEFSGAELPSGMYYFTLQSVGGVRTGIMVKIGR